MGMIVSIREAIEKLRFTSPNRGKVYKAELLVMLDRRDGGTGPDVALVKLANGEWTVLGSRHAPNGGWAVMDYGVDRLGKNVLSALVKAGAISSEDMAAHLEDEKNMAKRRERARAVESLNRACNDLGIPVPDIPEATHLARCAQLAAPGSFGEETK